MNFAEAAKEVFGYLGSHPFDDAMLGVISVLATAAGAGKYREYKEYRASRRRIDASDARLPNVWRAERDNDGTVRFYDVNGRLKITLPNHTPK